MTCQGVEFNGRCFPIYLIAVDWKQGPHPDPWRRIFDDLRALVTIDAGVATIADRRVRETLAEAVRGAAKSLDLPDGMKLGDGLFKGERVMEAAE